MKDGQYRLLHNKISGSQKLRHVAKDKPRWFRLGCHLVYTWLIPWGDDDGRLKSESFQIKAAVFPYADFSATDIENILIELDKINLLRWYEISGEHYIQLLDWAENQKIRKDRYKPSVYPPAPHQLPSDNQVGQSCNPLPLPTPSPSLIQKEKNFSEFWVLYCKNIAKNKCKKWYVSKVSDKMHLEIMDGLKKWWSSGQWEDLQFQPYPMKFLKEEKWKDSPEKRKNGKMSESEIFNALTTRR